MTEGEVTKIRKAGTKVTGTRELAVEATAAILRTKTFIIRTRWRKKSITIILYPFLHYNPLSWEMYTFKKNILLTPRFNSAV